MNPTLKLDHQLCFTLYTANKKMIQQYKPLLEPLNLTYPQYLVVLVLLEHHCLSVKAIGHRLNLDSGTLTPLLKRMEKHGYLERKRSTDDERKMLINLTQSGKLLEAKLSEIPIKMYGKSCMDIDALKSLQDELNKLINFIDS